MVARAREQPDMGQVSQWGLEPWSKPPPPLLKAHILLPLSERPAFESLLWKGEGQEGPGGSFKRQGEGVCWKGQREGEQEGTG